MSDKKLALLIGIDYLGSDMELTGCREDVRKVKEILINNLDFKEENIISLTEDREPKYHPTAMNIINNLGKLIIKAHHNQADHLFVHYSGHGASILDQDGDEKDNRDEVIVPLDVNKMGVITDDFMHDYIAYLPKGCKMFGLFDCCHSGTILDLRYRYYGIHNMVEENLKSDIEGDVFMVSGCHDSDVSMSDARKSPKSHDLKLNLKGVQIISFWCYL